MYKLFIVLPCARVVLILFTLFVFVRFGLFFLKLRKITGFRWQAKCSPGNVTLSSVLKPLLNHNSVSAPVNAFLARLTVEFDRLSTCWTFRFLN